MNEKFKQHGVNEVAYCVSRGAPDIYKKLKATGIPVLQIVKKRQSKRKTKDERVLTSFGKFSLRPCVEFKTPTIVRKNRSILKTNIKKKQGPSQKHRTNSQSLQSI